MDLPVFEVTKSCECETLSTETQVIDQPAWKISFPQLKGVMNLFQGEKSCGIDFELWLHIGLCSEFSVLSWFIWPGQWGCSKPHKEFHHRLYVHDVLRLPCPRGSMAKAFSEQDNIKPTSTCMAGGTLHSSSFLRNKGSWCMSPSSQEGSHWAILCVHHEASSFSTYN